MRNQKLLSVAVISVIAVCGYAAWIKYESKRQIAAPWHEVTVA